MEAGTMISLGNIDFNTEIPDSDDVLWYCRVDGWDTLEQRVDTFGRPTEHGGITGANLYDARSLSLIGTAVAEDADGYWAAYNGIVTETNYLNPFTDDELLLTIDEDVAKRMRVLRTGLQRRCVESEQILAFELTLRADD